jgi:thioredoxin-like negative regulator of GroEL
MSGLLFLQACDFSVQSGQRGDIVCNNIRGISLVLMYSTKCQHCQNLIPIFKRLPGTIGGCQFGMINVTVETDIVLMSRNSISPIKYVPLIILYVNGKPFIRYDGPHTEMDVKAFLIDVTNKLQTKEKFSVDKSKESKNNNREIPAYTVGVPLYGDEDEFYLEFNEAYNK